MKRKVLPAFWQGDIIRVWDLAEVTLLLNYMNKSLCFKLDFRKMCWVILFDEEYKKDTKYARYENTHELLKLYFVKVIPQQLA